MFAYAVSVFFFCQYSCLRYQIGSKKRLFRDKRRAISLSAHEWQILILTGQDNRVVMLFFQRYVQLQTRLYRVFHKLFCLFFLNCLDFICKTASFVCRIGCEYLEYTPIRAGVPQESVLGTIYLLYT